MKKKNKEVEWESTHPRSIISITTDSKTTTNKIGQHCLEHIGYI